MAYREGPFQDIKVPLTWAGAAAAIIAIVVALALLFTDRQEDGTPGANVGARTEFDRVIAPMAGVAAAPVRWVAQTTDSIGGYFFAVSENRRLKARVAELQGWRDAAIALKNINDRYESLLKLRTEPPIPMVSARIVSDARGPFSNARLADAGAEKGVKAGNPVISERGVVGRVVGVAPGASRVLLLTDVESRTPVLVDRTNARAILTGDGGSNPRLEFVRGRDPVKEGDRILTSGDGGLYPRGLPVGAAFKDVKGGWRVRLYTDQAGIDFVRILQFDDFTQGVDQTALENEALPALPPADRARIEAAEAPRPTPAPTAAPTPAKPAAATKPTAAQPTTPPKPALPSAPARANGAPAPAPAARPRPVQTTPVERPPTAAPPAEPSAAVPAQPAAQP